MATRLWTFLTADIADLAALDTGDRAADAADAVLGLAAALAAEHPPVERLAPLVGQLDSLFDAVNAPLGKLVSAPLPLTPIATGLLRLYQRHTQRSPTLAQAVALLSQVTYLESFRALVKRNPELEKLLIANDGTPRAKTITLEVKALGLYELTDAEARLAVAEFHRSALGDAFNQALRARLEQIGMPPALSARVVAAVAKTTNRPLRSAIAASHQV